MTKASSKITKANRLSRAVETLRAQRSDTTVSQALSVTPAAGTRLKKSVIKYPNSSAALRQHVEEMRKVDKPISAVRLRSRPAFETTAREKPQTTRPRAIEASRASTLEKTFPAKSPIAHAVAPADEPTVIKTVLALGDVVRHARRRQGLSQSELAAAAGTGRRFISELEAGKPTLEFERLLKVCNALGISILASEGAR